MKKLVLLTICLLTIQFAYSQQKMAREKYVINPNKPSQDTVYFKIKNKEIVYKKGTTIIETLNGKTIQRILTKGEIDTVKVDSAIIFKNKWFAGEISHTDKAPEKLFINPWQFTVDSLKHLNAKCHIKIPGNGYVRLFKTYFKWSAITIPFTIRPALNDTIGSKISTDLKLGASYSWNIGWETFKNRRIKVKKSSYGLSFGLGGGFSKISLDKNNTSLDEAPLKNSEDGLGFFLSPGIAINIRGFQLVGFWGYELGLTDNTKKWNYRNEAFWGVGLGVDLNTLGKIE